MAITRNVWLRGARQKAGGMVFYQAQGETRFRELAATVSNPRTEGQMGQRVKLANLVNFYRASRRWMQRAFEVKPQNNSDYNRFVSLNLTGNRIYLTKQEANAGACIVDAYRVTEGTLPSVEVTQSGEDWVTNLFLAGLPEITSNTTISAFATALLRANGGLLEGDQLSFIRLSQQTNPNTGVPYMIVRAYEVLLDVSDSSLLSDYLPIDYFDVKQLDSTDALGVVNSGNAGGFVLIVSRTIGSRIAVSTQDVVVANNDALINSHSSDAAKQTAIDSYGQGEEVFLSSASASSAGSQVVPVALLSVTIADESYVSNDVGPALEDIEQTTASVVFNTDVQGTAVVINLYYWDGTRQLWGGNIEGTIDGNTIDFDIPSAPAGKSANLLARIRVGIDSQAFEMDFLDDEIG